MQQVFYGAIAYPIISGCKSTADNVAEHQSAVTMTHEIFEAITDPDGGGWCDENTAPYPWAGCTPSPFNGQGDEIGDKCNQQAQSVSLTSGWYYVQAQWSNRASGCAVR